MLFYYHKSRLPASIPTVFTLTCLLFSGLRPGGPMGIAVEFGEAGHFSQPPMRGGGGITLPQTNQRLVT